MFDQFPPPEIQGFQDQLKEIQDSLRSNKNTAQEQNGSAGGDLVAELLDRCLKWAELVLEKLANLHRIVSNSDLIEPDKA